MKPPLYYAIRTGALYNPIIAVTTEKTHRWHGREVRDNTITHGVLSDLSGRFDSQEAAEAMREQIGKVADHFDNARKVLSQQSNVLFKREREAVAAILRGDAPDPLPWPTVTFEDFKS